MRCKLLCLACGVHTVDFENYHSMIQLAPNLALMQFLCPGCGLSLSVLVKLTAEMQRIFNQKTHSENQLHGSDPGFSSDLISHAIQELPDPGKLSYTSSLILEESDGGIGIIRPLDAYVEDYKATLDEFKQQLDIITTVDEAIQEIDLGCHHERSDV